VSTATDASKLLRPGLLEGRCVSIAGGSESLSAAVRSACAGLGADVAEWQPGGGAPDAQVDLLVVDGAGLFAGAAGQDSQGAAAGQPRDALRACLDGAWEATHAVANAAFLEPGRAGRIVYLAPAPDAGAYADAARASRTSRERCPSSGPDTASRPSRS
jgi:hypothetical protein